ncbi:MAG: hypothetical protein KDC83_02280 [Flavobacteriales bacterium]|nr:hypothetical protein [Flavobacteriales bacterium]
MEYKSLDHAKHNESICDHLSEQTQFNDWVITTAFYSAIHYVSHKLFPMTISKVTASITYESFDEYCNGENKFRRKHKEMRILVERNLPSDIAAAYNQLLDSSWTARYSQYKYSNKISKLARKRLTAVRNYCTK